MASSVTKLKTFEFLRGEIKHEYEVLGSRLTSYITSQSFLVSAFAVSLNNSSPIVRLWFPLIVCATGLVLSWRAQPGITSAVTILNALHSRQWELYKDEDVQALDPVDPAFLASVHEQSLKFASLAAMIFSLAWFAMLALAVVLKLQS